MGVISFFLEKIIVPQVIASNYDFRLEGGPRGIDAKKVQNV